MNDQTEQLARRQIALMAAETVRQLSVSREWTPIAMMLSLAKREAETALTALIDTPPEETEAIRTLQNDIHRFRNLLRWLAELVADGEHAETLLSQEEREELLDAIHAPEDN